ncbi:MAG: hypothetical protein CMP98_06300 [Gammaproteobacteria bacterium]|nr:hypothetical protein [Gammaproteobacteria bacterium]OUU09960.1 MAG: hypothetical protein CBB94_06395 [Gammaproteobacteria bacterium TMED34]
MSVVEPDSFGRSKCRGCKQNIAKGSLRFDEQLPIPFADGDMSLWLHLPCAAFRRPQVLLTTVNIAPLKDRQCHDHLTEISHIGTEVSRLKRIAETELSPNGRARCKSYKEPIPKDSWRIRQEHFGEGASTPSGNIHLGCVNLFFPTNETVLVRTQYFAPSLTEAQLPDINGTRQ